MSWMPVVVRFILLLAFFVPVSTTVIETTQSYFCTEELHQVESEYAVANPDCEQYWSAQENSIGTFLKLTPECHRPCHELFAGRIFLTDCINITLAVICSRDYLTEHLVHFYGKRIPQSLSNHVKRERIGIVLSVVVLIMSVCCIAIQILWKK